MNTKLIPEALEACLRVLPATRQEEIEKAQAALSIARDLVKQEFANIILSGLLAMEYGPEDVIFRVTVKDFVDLLASYMVERGVSPNLTPDELEWLVSTACDYLGESMPWENVVKDALTDAWPERLKGDA